MEYFDVISFAIRFVLTILANFFAFSFFAKMRKKFWILCEKSEENEEIAKGKKSPFLWQTELENDLPFFFIPFLCHNVLENVIVWKKISKKILILQSWTKKLAKSEKRPTRQFLLLFYVIFSPANLEFCPDNVKFC